MSVWVALLAVAGGGAIGAVLRWGVTLATASLPTGRWAGFPVGTLLVNVVGTFLLAWFVASSSSREWASPALRLFITTGVLGALTTFSTFGLDAHGLLQQGRSLQALLYVGATLTLAGGAVLLGWVVGR